MLRRWVGEALRSRASPASVSTAWVTRASVAQAARATSPSRSSRSTSRVSPDRESSTFDGQLGHPQAAVGRLGELQQDVVPGEREVVLGEQVGLEPAHHLVVRAQEQPPALQRRGLSAASQRSQGGW